MSSPSGSLPGSPHSFLSFEDIFFSEEQFNANEQPLDNVINNEPEKKEYNTRGKAKTGVSNQLERNDTSIIIPEKKPRKEKAALHEDGSLDNILDDIFALLEEDDFKNVNDDNDQDDFPKTDPLIDLEGISLDSPSELQTGSSRTKMSQSELEIEEGVDPKPSDAEIIILDQNEQKPSEQPNNHIENNNTPTEASTTPLLPPKRHSLRKRNDIQLHPYSLEKAKYMSLLHRTPRSKAARDRIDDYIGSSQYAEEPEDDDPDFVPGQDNIPTQNESIIQETQEPEWDSNVLILPKPRSKTLSVRQNKSNDTNRNNNNNSITTTTTNTTATTRNNKSNSKSRTIVESLLDSEESVSRTNGSSPHYLQTDPISSLPPLSNTKGKHHIIHTYKRKNKRYPSTLGGSSLTKSSSVFDFDSEPHDLFNWNNNNDDTTTQISDDEEDTLQLSKKRSKKRRVIISDSDDEDEEENSNDDSVILLERGTDNRRNHRTSLLEPNSVADFDNMVNNSSQAQEQQRSTSRSTYRRQRSDDYIVEDENELKMNENRRVRLNDIATNKNTLHGILPKSFLSVFKSQLEEDIKSQQARKSIPVKRKVVEKENETVRPILHTPVDIFSDEEGDEGDRNEPSQQQQNTSSSLYTRSQSLGQFDEAREDNRTTDDFMYESASNTQTWPKLTQTPLRLSQSSSAMEYNRLPNHYSREPKRSSSNSNSQASSRKKRRRKIHKTTDDIYIRPSRHYWNDETIDRMLLRQGKQQDHSQQKMSHDDISIGPTSHRPSTTSHGIRITWIHNMEDYLKNERLGSSKNSKNSDLTIKALKEQEAKRLSRIQHEDQQQQHRQKKLENITVASVLERIGDLVDADLRTTVGLSDTVYLHHRLLPSLLSGARNKKKYFERFKPLLETPIIYNTRITWKDVVPTQLQLIRGWFWRAFYDIANAFQEQQTTIDSTFYIFTSVCISRWIPTLSGDAQMAMVKIYNTEARIFASQICQFVIQNNSSPFIPWKVVIEALLFTLDWKCRLIHLGSDEGVWPLTDLTSSLIHLLVQIGPERITMGATSYISEAWICLLQIMSVSTDMDGYRFSEQTFLEQLEKWVDDRASKETWSKSFKTQSMKQWAIAFKHIFDKYML